MAWVWVGFDGNNVAYRSVGIPNLTHIDTYNHTHKNAVAGVMGAKRTSELVPFCHPLSLDDCQVRYLKPVSNDQTHQPYLTHLHSLTTHPSEYTCIQRRHQVELRFDGPARPNEVVVDCTVRVQGRTGVEMEVRMRCGSGSCVCVCVLCVLCVCVCVVCVCVCVCAFLNDHCHLRVRSLS